MYRSSGVQEYCESAQLVLGPGGQIISAFEHGHNSDRRGSGKYAAAPVALCILNSFVQKQVSFDLTTFFIAANQLSDI